MTPRKKPGKPFHTAPRSISSSLTRRKHKLKQVLIEAAKDLRHLLNRGYNREGAVSFVGDRYQLNREERFLLYRTIYDDQSAEEHRRKMLPIKAINGKELAVDGYNVLITVESLIKGLPLVYSDDGLIRDVSGVFRGYQITDITYHATNLILKEIQTHHPASVHFFFDEPISRSGELANYFRQELKKHDLKGNAETVKMADKASTMTGEITASSDCVVIDHATKIVDIAGEIAKKKHPKKLFRLTEI